MWLLGLSAQVAQLTEPLTCKQRVVGTSLALGTLFPPSSTLIYLKEKFAWICPVCISVLKARAQLFKVNDVVS